MGGRIHQMATMQRLMEVRGAAAIFSLADVQIRLQAIVGPMGGVKPYPQLKDPINYYMHLYMRRMNRLELLIK